MIARDEDEKAVPSVDVKAPGSSQQGPCPTFLVSQYGRIAALIDGYSCSVPAVSADFGADWRVREAVRIAPHEARLGVAPFWLEHVEAGARLIVLVVDLVAPAPVRFAVAFGIDDDSLGHLEQIARAGRIGLTTAGLTPGYSDRWMRNHSLALKVRTVDLRHMIGRHWRTLEGDLKA